jgi:predicted phosphodiesterase
MRIAVLSDIHGFSLALETVFADLEQQEPFDQIVVAGDLCEVGPDPAGVLELLWERDLIVLQGNTDLDLVIAARRHGARDSVEFAVDQIGQDGIDYLAGLPFSHRITPPGGASPADDLLVVHANPHDLYERLTPDDSDDQLRSTIGNVEFAALAFGHYHVCYIRELDHRLLVDVSAVGNPKDGDLRCKYGIFTWSEPERRWTAELRKLDYPLEATKDQIRDSDLPNHEKAIRKLEKASY